MIAREVIAELEHVGPDGCVLVACAAIADLDAPRLARIGVALFQQLDVIAKSNPQGAGEIAAALYGMLSAYRPESPAPLDAGFVPTEAAHDPREVSP